MRLFAAMLAFALCVLVFALYRAQLSSLFWRIGVPVMAFRNSLNATENAQLRAELASTTAALADRDALYRENVLLKAQFGRDTALHGILAGVVMAPPGIPYDTLLIDAGSAQGISTGDLVSAGGTTVIGTVSEVYATASRVKLFSSPGESYQAFVVHGATSIPVSIEGQGAGSMEGQIPAGSVVAEGDTVEFPGIAGGFVGQVSHVDAKNGESFQTVYVRLPVDLFSLRFVEVRPAHTSAL